MEPGGFAPVESIPKAEQTMVGQTVQIVLAQERQNISFYYRYDTAEDSEKLAVITEEKFPLLIVFDTKLGGIQSLCEKIKNEEAIGAVVSAIANIGASYSIYTFLVPNWLEREYGIDVYDGMGESTSGAYVGYIDVKGSHKLAGVDITDAFLSELMVWHRIFECFSIEW